MAGNYEDILKIPVDDSAIEPATKKLAEMDSMIQKASKRSVQSFTEFDSTVQKTNKSLEKTGVHIDKIFQKMKLSNLSQGLVGLGRSALTGAGTIGQEALGVIGMGGLAGAGIVGAIAYAIKEAIGLATGSLKTTMMARRSGITPGQNLGLDYAEAQAGLSTGSLVSSVYALNNSLKDVTKAGAISVLGGGALDINKLSKEDPATAMFEIGKAIGKNPMAKNPAMRAMLIRKGQELGLTQDFMLDALAGNTAQIESDYLAGRSEVTDWSAENRAGRGVNKVKTAFKIGANKALSETVKGYEAGVKAVSTVIIKLGDGLKGTVEKNSDVTNTIIKQTP